MTDSGDPEMRPMNGPNKEARSMRYVRDCMTTTPLSVAPDASLREVRNVFTTNPFHHLLVTEHGRLVGVLSDRDVLKHLSPYLDTFGERRADAACLDKRVHQIMSRRPLAIDPDHSISDAAALMRMQQVSCLPVVDAGGHICGVITSNDLLHALATLIRDDEQGSAASDAA